MSEKETEYVKLISAEGHEFIIDKEAAMVSGTIRAMMQSPGSFAESETGEINFREVPTHILEKVIQYFYYKLKYNHSKTEIPEFKIEPEIAMDLLMAAHFLDT